MFFILSKTAGFFAAPSNLVIAMGLVGVVLLGTRFARTGRRLAVASLLLLAVLGFSPVGNMLMLPLEDRFPPWDVAQGTPDGILVLGGAVGPETSAARNTVALDEAAERLTAVADLARRFPAARIVYSGGSGSLISHEHAEADYVLPLFESFGIARERIILENRSRNTVENAVFSKEMVRPKPAERWLLVTSAHHMPRSMGIFRAAGFPVEAYPVDWRTRGVHDRWQMFNTLGDGLRRTDTAMREWIGLVVYWLTGRSASLFPAPN